MKINKKNKHAISAQGMVEFALVLPILLLLVFGTLELGRMVFIYVSISSASREAVRYGSATDIDKTNQYKDCVGIRAAANAVDFFKAIQTIDINYYHTNSTTAYATCPANATTWSPNGILALGDRIEVIVKGDFVPVTSFVPFIPRLTGSASPNPIVSSNYHTLLAVVPVPLTTFTAGPTRTTIPTQTLVPTNTPKHSSATDTPVPPTITPSCIVSSGPLVISSDYGSITLNMNNQNAFSLNIQDIYVTWPTNSGTLTTVVIDGVTVNVNAPPTNVHIPGGGLASLSPGAHTLIFNFHYTPLSGAFQISVGFTNPLCLAFLKTITVYPVTHSGPISNANPTTSAWILTNHTNQPLAISYIEIFWKCSGKNGANLIGIHLNGYSFTFSAHNTSSCSGFIFTPTSIWNLNPGGSNSLTLTFDQNVTQNLRVILSLQCYQGGNNYCQFVDSNEDLMRTP